ncbi:DUF5913 domain-containing protein, partial [Fibrobacterales bacterium]|nr:DUF5913 domain-containing protein [Fibrobacterales bacterium]
RFVPFDQELQYGSTINILTSNEQHPNREWLNIVKTSKSKQHVRRYLRIEEQNRQLKLGKIILEREVNKRGGELPELELFTQKFGIENWDEMYAELGEGHTLQSELSSFLSEFLVDKRKKEECFLISTHNIQLIQFASCCSPIPGDSLLGLLKSHDGIFIHRSSCLEGLSESEVHPEYIFPIAWENDEANDFEVQIEVQGEDCEGLLQKITQTFSDFNISVIRASIETRGSEIRNFFEVKVASLTHLHAAIRKISEIDKIKNVRRL